MIIPNKLWLRQEGRFLSYGEILESGLSELNLQRRYDDAGIDVVENIPEDIAAVAVEMDERLKRTWQINPEDEELQQRFWSLWRPG